MHQAYNRKYTDNEVRLMRAMWRAGYRVSQIEIEFETRNKLHYVIRGVTYKDVPHAVTDREYRARLGKRNRQAVLYEPKRAVS